MYCCLRLIYIGGVINCNEWKTEKRHECANMWKVKRLELWWQLYRTSLPVWDLENFRPMDFWQSVQLRCFCTTFVPCAFVLFNIIRQYRTHVQPKKECPCYLRYTYLPFLDTFAELRKATINFVMSVRPQGTTRLPLYEFSWSLIFEYFYKMCQENSISIKISQE